MSWVRGHTNENFSSFLLTPYWSRYFSETTATYRELLPGRLEEALLMDIINVGLTYDPHPRAGLEYIKLGSVEASVFGTTDYFRDKKHIKDIAFVTPVAPLESIPSNAKGLDGWPEPQFPRKILFQADLLSSGLNLAGQGLCAIYIANFVAKTFNQNASKKLNAFTLPTTFKAQHREIYLIQKKGISETPELRKLAKLIRNHSS